MNRSEDEEKPVLKQLREALGGISQEALAKQIGCSVRKIWRGENGTEPTWTTSEAKRLNSLLQENFEASLMDLPDSLKAAAPLPFLSKPKKIDES